MRRLLLIGLLGLLAWPEASAAGLSVTNTVAFTRADGSAVPFAPSLRVNCWPWERGVPRRTLHIRVGVREGPFWQLRVVVADVKRRPVVRFPHSFVFNRPTGAEVFAFDSDNEASSAEEEASGQISFGGPLRPPARGPVPGARGARQRVIRRRAVDDARFVPRLDVAPVSSPARGPIGDSAGGHANPTVRR